MSDTSVDFTTEFTITWDAVRTMNREVSGPVMVRGSFALMSIILLIGDLLLVVAGRAAGYTVMCLSIIIPLLFLLIHRYGLRHSYESGVSKGRTVHYSFYKEFFKTHSEISDSKFRYDELYRIVEGKSAFYLYTSGSQAFIVGKKDAALNEFLRGFTEKTSYRAENILTVFVVIAALFSTAFIVIYRNRPDNYVLREWVSNMPVGIALLWFLVLVYVFILCNVRNIPRIRKRGKRIAARIVSIVVTVILMAALGLVVFVCELFTGSVSKNDNGTYTYTYNGYQYILCEDGGPFYLHCIRSMTGPDDIAPVPSEQPIGQQTQQVEEDTQQGSTESSEESSAATTLESAEETAAQKIETGYRVLYNTYFEPQGDSFEKEYDAKANSYVVLSEDSSSIRYLMYDRDSANDRCGLYVLFEAQKASDGSWSPSDATILDMYAYEYSTGTVADSGKTDWAGTGSEEYRALTGE